MDYTDHQQIIANTLAKSESKKKQQEQIQQQRLQEIQQQIIFFKQQQNQQKIEQKEQQQKQTSFNSQIQLQKQQQQQKYLNKYHIQQQHNIEYHKKLQKVKKIGNTDILSKYIKYHPSIKNTGIKYSEIDTARTEEKLQIRTEAIRDNLLILKEKIKNPSTYNHNQSQTPNSNYNSSHITQSPSSSTNNTISQKQIQHTIKIKTNLKNNNLS